jgi:pimeloyl-ACP methyl ester carboxylesterase
MNETLTGLPVRIVDVVTDDAIRLSGAFLDAQTAATSASPFDAVLMMHGAGGSFYDPFFRFFADELAQRGYPVLRANNRGHGVISRTGGASAPYLGMGLERVADADRDWRAWIAFLETLGYRRVLLFGHSLGALKSVRYLASTRDARVTGCIIASPPRFSYERWIRSPLADRFGEHLARARALVDAGTPDALFPVSVPIPFLSGAQAYLDKYGPDADLDLFAHLERVACPVLAITGEKELEKVPYADHLERYSEAQRKIRLRHVVVPGGNHWYSRMHPFVLDAIVEWIASVSPHASR